MFVHGKYLITYLHLSILWTRIKYHLCDIKDSMCFMKDNSPGGQIRKKIQIGSMVEIVQKKDQQSGELTEGFVKRILTKSPNHPHGIKVMLATGEVGRVKNIL